MGIDSAASLTAMGIESAELLTATGIDVTARDICDANLGYSVTDLGLSHSSARERLTAMGIDLTANYQS